MPTTETNINRMSVPPPAVSPDVDGATAHVANDAWNGSTAAATPASPLTVAFREDPFPTTCVVSF